MISSTSKTQLHSKLNFDFDQKVYDEINDYIARRIPDFTKGELVLLCKLYHNGESQLTKEVVDSINKTLASNGLPKMFNLIIFMRNTVKDNFDSCHVDTTEFFTFKSSLIFPVTGCENSYMYWCDGDYTLVEQIHPAWKTRYSTLEWNSDKRVIEEVEITSPTATRVDIPHNAYSNNSIPRIVFTIRLFENLSVDEIAERIENSKVKIPKHRR